MKNPRSVREVSETIDALVKLLKAEGFRDEEIIRALAVKMNSVSSPAGRIQLDLNPVSE